jgi:bifunctional DNA-binding transcriptional regulator/antitoxin component of YhaV-PrlF toxin-antitoxin module
MHPESRGCKGDRTYMPTGARNAVMDQTTFGSYGAFGGILRYGTRMGIVTKISGGGKLNVPAQIRRQVGLDRGGPVMVSVVGDEVRIRSVRHVLADLQREASRVFAGSGESVEQFLRDRRDEAERDGDTT